ncbi:unnamed protein product [Trichobilharzia regenti]|nr:unnamed protein product [Trichobilharzia regenti]
MDADIAQLTELLLRPERATCIGATGGIVVPDDSFGDAVDTSSSNISGKNNHHYNHNNNNNQFNHQIESGNHSPQTYIIRKPESFTIYQDKPLYMQRLLAECDDTASTISTSSSVTDITPQKSGGDNR